MRRLADAEVPNETALGRSLASAAAVTSGLEAFRWDRLRPLQEAQSGEGPRAESAAQILERLRRNLESDEMVLAIQTALRQADDDLFAWLAPPPPPDPETAQASATHRSRPADAPRRRAGRRAARRAAGLPCQPRGRGNHRGVAGRVSTLTQAPAATVVTPAMVRALLDYVSEKGYHPPTVPSASAGAWPSTSPTPSTRDTRSGSSLANPRSRCGRRCWTGCPTVGW